MTRMVLIVEDELLIRMVAAETLADFGFTTQEAGSASEASGILLADMESFAAVIIDIGLPDRPGDQLAAELRERSAELPIVIATGHDRSRVPKALQDDPRIRFVSKPYDYRALNTALGLLGVTGDQAAGRRGSASQG